MIEQRLLEYLNSSLSPVPCYMEMPEDPTGQFVIIDKTGSSVTNRITKANFAIQSYADTLYEAAELNERVKEAMDSMLELGTISKVELNSDYNFTDTDLKAHRYQAGFVLTYY